MAFPATYNFSYYKGDTLEFNVYPKKADGSAFDLTGYSVKMAFAESRGTSGASSRHEVSNVSISSDNTYIRCAIVGSTVGHSGDSDYLNAGTNYVYDVEITKAANGSTIPYALVHTVLTGTITVTDQVVSL